MEKYKVEITFRVSEGFDKKPQMSFSIEDMESLDGSSMSLKQYTNLINYLTEMELEEDQIEGVDLKKLMEDELYDEKEYEAKGELHYESIEHSTEYGIEYDYNLWIDVKEFKEVKHWCTEDHQSNWGIPLEYHNDEKCWWLKIKQINTDKFFVNSGYNCISKTRFMDSDTLFKRLGCDWEDKQADEDGKFKEND